jgi:hypothetical protein
MKHIFLAILIATLFSSCYKQVDGTTTTTTKDTTVTNTTPPNIMFYNVMDYGNVYVILNSTNNLGGVAKWYPLSYTAGVVGTNNIIVTFSNDTIINQNVDLLAGKNYSCFVYRIGYSWFLSIVPDNLTTPSVGNSEIRVLDFRTQAWFSYIGVNIFSPGIAPLVFNNRNFLDHESYSGYENFNTLPSAIYTTTLYITTPTAENLTTQTDTLASQKIYTLVLMTQASLTAAQALQNIQIELSSNN